MGTLFSQHKILVVIAGVAIAGGVWYGLSPSSAPAASPLTSEEVGPGQEVVETLRRLDAVKLDGTLFTEPAFSALKDFSTQIIPESVGRPNPFAPLSTNAQATASTTKAAQIFAPGSRR